MFWLFSGERVKIVSLVFQALFCPDLPGLKLAFPCNHQQATQQLLVSCLHILRQIVLQTYFVKLNRIILRNARQIAQFKYNFLEIINIPLIVLRLYKYRNELRAHHV